MIRRDVIELTAWIVIALSLTGVLSASDATKEHPNILFIMTDDMGYGDASCYNPDSIIKTPNIDRLASTGMRFTDAHSPSSVCTPTRYNVLTGRYCWRSRLKRGVFGGYNKPLIEQDRVTVASFLKQHGYSTACIGKWHLGWNWGTKDGRQPEWDYEQEDIDFSKAISHGPTDLGFDYFFGTSGCTTDDPPLCFIENDRTVGIPDRYAAEDPADEGRLLMSVKGWRHEEADFEFMNKALGFTENSSKKDKPFFVYLPLSVPHIPWLPHEDFKGKSGAGPRGDQVLMADHVLGKVVEKLDALNISEKTLVIFTSDNGPRKGVNGHESAGKWRGYKGSIWEGGHRVPFIAKWPGKIRPGTTCDQTIALTDLMATCAAIVGETLPPEAGEDSCDILPALLGATVDKPIHDVCIHHSGGGVFAVRVGQWKLIWECEEAGYDDGPEPGGPGQLYNLKTDPFERHNLFGQRPKKVAELSAILARVQAGNYRKCDAKGMAGDWPQYLGHDIIDAGQDDGIVATASSTDDIAAAMNTVDGSGLEGNVHSTEWDHTWTSDGGAGNPPAPSPNPVRGESQWIHYDLGQVYPLGRMHVWNGNEISARGLKRVSIDHSADGISWSELGTFNFAQASGSSRYAGFEGPDFGGAQARYVLLTIHSNHGGEFGYALSEIEITVGPLDAKPLEGKGRDKRVMPNKPPGSQAESIAKPVWGKADRFSAQGNTDPNHRASARKRAEVEVGFDLLPTKMRFNLPSFPCLVTENNISYYNGWTETYDAAAGVGSCEPLMDHGNQYSRMWIESQNDARIVVRWRAALVSNDGVIAHKDAPKVSPYGPGDWVDECYTIYPDGVHVRKSKIYTHFAAQAKPFGWDRDPPNYIFEFQEMLFLGEQGHLPEDDIQTKALTLIKMNGDHSTISYDPYPVHFEPEEEELYAAFGDFWNANIFVVNTKSRYHPFTIGRAEGVSVSPYAPERRRRRGIFQSWPQNPNRREGYHGTALGHIVLRSFYERTDPTLTQVYLSGFTDAGAPHKELVPLARSWLHAPGIRLIQPVAANKLAYDPAQRAYLIDCDRATIAEYIQFEVAASENSPVVNPAFLINNWGKSDVILEVNGAEIDGGTDFRLGHYPSLDMDGAGQWRDVLIVWVQMKSSKPVHVKIWPKLF